MVPYPASRNDVAMWNSSGLDQQLDPIVSQGGTIFHIFGDKAYLRSEADHGAVQTCRNSLGKKQYNREMSRLRVSVEHGYGRITSLWSFQ